MPAEPAGSHTGTATILFTDLVALTTWRIQLGEEHAEARRQARGPHVHADRARGAEGPPRARGDVRRRVGAASADRLPPAAPARDALAVRDVRAWRRGGSARARVGEGEGRPAAGRARRG